MTIPEWADASLSADLKRLCAVGESQAIEFKSGFPTQARDLAKEIAAFSSSNAGQILLGVSDDGRVAGLPGCAEQSNRDAVAERIAGISKHVKPPVHPELSWAVVDDAVVCVLRISKGPAPIYYFDHRPYIRRLTSSRPAEPDEVIEAVRRFLGSQPESNKEDHEASKFLGEAASLLVQALRWSDLDLGDRNLKPWLDYWEYEGKALAASLRSSAADERADASGIAASLRAIATAVDKVMRAPRVLGGGRDFDELVSAVNEAAFVALSKYISPVKLDASTAKELAASMTKYMRQLSDAWELAEAEPFSDAFENAVNLSATVGLKILEWSYYPAEQFAGTRGDDIRMIAKALAAMRFESVYYDGGESQRKVIGMGNSATRNLGSWLEGNAMAGELVEQTDERL